MNKKIKMYNFFDIKEEFWEFKMKVFKKHPNLMEEVKELKNIIDWTKKPKALALKEILLKTRIEPDELNSKYLIKECDEILNYSEDATSVTGENNG